MTGNELKKILKNKLSKDELVELFRYGIDDCSMLVNPDMISDRLLLVRQAGDFRTDGYRILRNDDISEVVTCDKNPGLRFTNEIFIKEKLFDKKLSLNIDSWNSVFEYISDKNETVMIECSYEDAVDYYFCKIMSVNDKIAVLRCFDGAGVLFADMVKINLDFVSSVTIGDRYTTYMGNHVMW